MRFWSCSSSILSLFHDIISYLFLLVPVYNVDESTFKQNEKDPAKISAFYNDAVKELAVLRRSAIVNQLYGGWKLVVEKQKPAMERGDT